VTRVYLSYDRQDAGAVRRLADALEQRGMKVWRDPMNLSPGVSWEGEVERGLREADVFLALWSRNSAESDWVEREAQYGHLLGKLVCARIDGGMDLDELPRFCRSYALQDIYPRALRGMSDPYERLVGAIRAVSGKKIMLEDRPLASEPQALANSRRGHELLPGLLRDRERSAPREVRYGNALRELSRSAWGHVRFGVERFITTNPGDSGEGALSTLYAAIEESNDASTWGLFGDLIAPFEPMAAFAAYRRAGLPPDYVETLVPARERREAYLESPSGRNRSGVRAALATVAALVVLAGAGVVGITQLGSRPSESPIQISSAVTSPGEPMASATRADPAPVQPAEAPQPEWAEVQPQAGPSAAIPPAGRTGDLPSLPPAPPPPPPPPPPVAVEPAPPPPALPVSEPAPVSLPEPAPPIPLGVIKLCRAGPLAPGERAEYVELDESIGKFALRVSQGGADRIYERNKACLDDLSRRIPRPDGTYLEGRDLLFPRDMLVIPADLPGPAWMSIGAPAAAGELAPAREATPPP
jgi:hypothetical protein